MNRQASSALHGPAASALRERALIEALASAIIVYIAGGAIEALLIAALRPTEWELTWISDVVVSAAFGVAVYLWRHLRATRLELNQRERAELVLRTQLELAASMQQRLLPPAPAAAHGLDWAAMLVPAGRIGGDFYDFVEQAPGVWMVLVADVSGKGVPAAMALGLLRATFRSLAREATGPAELTTRLSSALREEWAGEPYVTCIVARVDAHARSLTTTNAGHPAGLVVRDAGTERLTVGGPPVALLRRAHYAEETLVLLPGDRCLFVTDGVTEALEGGPRPPADIVVTTARNAGSSNRALCDAVMAQAMLGAGPPGVDDWSDDRTVVAVSVGAIDSRGSAALARS